MKAPWQALTALVPASPHSPIPWEDWENSPVGRWIPELSQTQQNPYWHGEGDVWTHTRMVCQCLTEDEDFWAQPERKRQILFLAALLHDVGKIPCTQWEDGTWKSPNHTAVGARMARSFLWADLGCSGSREAQSFRECVCTLIRYHSVPVHILEQPDPERRLFEIAAMGELIPEFSLELLRILVRSDIRGRKAGDIGAFLENMELCFLMAEELGILHHPGAFPSPHTRHAYLAGKKVWREQELYNDTWGQVILLSGLPGTGKDHWIRENCPDIPMISLDDIRREKHISPEDNQSAVIQEAKERAKAFLRQKQPFVWNATNLTPQTRNKQLRLFEDYGAGVRVVFLETGWDTGLTRNDSRKARVPRQAVEDMLTKLEPPLPQEAEQVEWIIT